MRWSAPGGLRRLAEDSARGTQRAIDQIRDIVANGPTHCGRGSVANSIVSYCLGITHVEPLGAGLLFERFLNPERKDPPDIDLDFPWDERDQVLEDVFRRYPRLHSAMVANQNCFQVRGALREVAKVHGRPAGEGTLTDLVRSVPVLLLHHGPAQATSSSPTTSPATPQRRGMPAGRRYRSYLPPSRFCRDCKAGA